MIEVVINGSPRQIPENLNIRALLEHLQLPTDRVAVEHNLRVLSKGDWEAIVLRPADRLEIVHFVGGG